MRYLRTQGAKISCSKEHGGEVLFLRGTQYEVLSGITQSNGDMYVVLKYIIPK